MMRIARKLLTKRLKEVDAEIMRASLIPAPGQHSYEKQKLLGQLRAYRKELTTELELLDTY